MEALTGLAPLGTMSLTNLLKKATDLLGLSSPERLLRPPPLNGEIIYCKNNVCVHPPAALRQEGDHFPGYLNIRSQDDEVLGSTLILTWIPNSTLQRNPRSLENSPRHPGGPHPRLSPRLSPRQEFARPDPFCPQQQQQQQQQGDESPSSPTRPEEEEQEGGRGAEDGDGDGEEEALTNGHGEGDVRGLSGRIVYDESTDSLYDSTEGGGGHHQPKHNGERVGPAGQVAAEGRTRVRDRESEGRTGGGGGGGGGEMGDEQRTMRETRGLSGHSQSLSSCSSSTTSSGSPGGERQLHALLQHKNRVSEIRKERTGSNRSVTSIEMEGDNLVVVTEELEAEDDAIFLEDDQDGDPRGRAGHDEEDKGDSDGGMVTQGGRSHKDSGVGTLTSRDTDYTTSTSSSEYPSPTSEHFHRLLGELQQQRQQGEQQQQQQQEQQPSSQGEPLVTASLTESSLQTHTRAEMEKLKESLNLQLDATTVAAPISSRTPDIEVTGSPASTGSGSTSGPDSRPPTPFTPLGSPHGSSASSTDAAVVEDDAESECAAENMSFPHSSVSYSRQHREHRNGQNGGGGGQRVRSAKEQVCGVFSVDLGQMRSLRIFYSDDACTSGQLVIASRESQYKILHFHHGGLERLAEVFADWKFLAKPKDKRKEVDNLCEHFSVIRPYLPKEQSHPEEGAYELVNEDTWRQHMNHQGQIEDDLNLRKAIFFAGLNPKLRHEMWPFLLHYYPFNSTYEEREQLRNDKYIEYQNVRKQRESMNPEDYQHFWRTVQSTVEKDVIRTDRTHPYFRGENNPNIEILQNILLNYAVAHPSYGYTQGMSDLLAPVLVEVQNEVDAYWCFEGLMERTIFVSSPKDVDMDRQLLYLRELLRVMRPRFHRHLQKVQDGMELLFCHRWILLCFKREFPEVDALRMWEACWAHYQTDYFHLFLCVAIIAVYGEDVVQQDLPADEMLLHFSSLSMHMSGEVVLRKARAILHQFRTRRKIPCTLDGLCMLCGPGMWDSGHVPAIVCVGDHDDGVCPHSDQSQE